MITDEKKLIKIVLVEDNQDDIFLIQRAMKEVGIVNELCIARDGAEALTLIRSVAVLGHDGLCTQPGLILLDINLPKMNGVEVLKALKADPALRYIPVVMLTVSKRDEDIVKSYNNGCNSFIQKPVQFESFVETVKNIGLYWGLLNINVS
jgi:two-component system, response regulator